MTPTLNGSSTPAAASLPPWAKTSVVDKSKSTSNTVSFFIEISFLLISRGTLCPTRKVYAMGWVLSNKKCNNLQLVGASYPPERQGVPSHRLTRIQYITLQRIPRALLCIRKYNYEVKSSISLRFALGYHPISYR